MHTVGVSGPITKLGKIGNPSARFPYTVGNDFGIVSPQNVRGSVHLAGISFPALK